MYPYGLIGNCQTAALVGTSGSIDWLCMPRPDSPPVFGKLLDPDGGHFSIEIVGNYKSTQSYIQNTNVLTTTFTLEDGSEFRVTDFCPRFHQHGRAYRPVSLFRIVEPIIGSPTIRVVCRPVDGWTKTPVKPERGNSHLRYTINNETLRLVTNMPITYLIDESSFVLKEPIQLGLTWSLGVEDDLKQVTDRFLKQTIEYWETWVKHCSIPSLYQDETIRSALALKLHCYEDTGAILAALTTSLPEEVGHERNWDYRLCWLRDTYFSLTAFHNLGHFEEMEGFIKFLINIAEKSDLANERLHPVYRLDQTLPLPEKEHRNWAGYRNSHPVRSDNQAAEHVQNDAYGEMVLTLSPIFFDNRFLHLRTPEHERLLERLVRLCEQTISEPDAGLWELRDGWQEHTFSNLLCWAGIERAIRIQELGFLKEVGIDLKAAAAKAEKAIMAAVKDGSLRNGPKDDTYDSSLLLITNFRLPDEELAKETVRQIHEQLKLGQSRPISSFLYRYLRKDDFGLPSSAFMICSFWLVQALARIGDLTEARKVMADIMPAANHVGLFSEHFFAEEARQAGNFPQAYSHVGQINAAFAISPPWADIL